MKTEFLAGISIVMSVAGQFVLRAGMVRFGPADATSAGETMSHAFRALAHPLVISGLGLYVMSTITWLAVLSRWEVSKAYPLVGIGFVLSAVTGAFLGEAVGLVRVLGILLITAGVFLVSIS